MAGEMNYEVDNPEIKAVLRDIGERIASALPDGWGFNLLIFSFGEKGSMFYLSNAHRESMIEAMQEFIAKHGGGG